MSSKRSQRSLRQGSRRTSAKGKCHPPLNKALLQTTRTCASPSQSTFSWSSSEHSLARWLKHSTTGNIKQCTYVSKGLTLFGKDWMTSPRDTSSGSSAPTER